MDTPRSDIYELMIEQHHQDPTTMGPVDVTIANWIADKIPYTDRIDQARCIAFRHKQTKKIVYGGAFNEHRGRDIQYHAACTDPKVLTKGRIELLFWYGFMVFNTARISCVVAKSNKRSQKVVEGLGWKREGLIREFYAADDDAILYGMLRNECKWI